VAPRSELSGLDQLSRQLPFSLDALDRVGEVFDRWRKRGRPDDERTVALWTYCYVRRYFLVRFAREASYTLGELEEVVERAYKRVEKGRHGLRIADRYPRWVVVVCRNTYLNFVTRRRESVRVDRIAEPQDEDIDLEALHDGTGFMLVLGAAIDRLPSFLKQVASLRYVDGMEYDEIAVQVEKDVATVRAYAHKAVVRFRKDRHLMTCLRKRTGYGSSPEGSIEKDGYAA
jgi:RNA polymerase sigma factor (sigma-70 family)